MTKEHVLHGQFATHSAPNLWPVWHSSASPVKLFWFFSEVELFWKKCLAK
jgi:hypothetical protein